MTTTTTETRCPKGGRCEGDGWVLVTEAYVDGMYPWPAKPTDDSPEALAEYELRVETIRIRRESAAATVYPCKRCSPDAFHRWAGRHWMPDHDRAKCDECKSGKAGTPAGPSATNERPDRVENEEPPAVEQPPLDAYADGWDERSDLR